MDDDPKPGEWFGPKKFGVGVGPTGWKGWTLILVILIAAAVLAAVLHAHRASHG